MKEVEAFSRELQPRYSLEDRSRTSLMVASSKQVTLLDRRSLAPLEVSTAEELEVSSLVIASPWLSRQVTYVDWQSTRRNGEKFLVESFH